MRVARTVLLSDEQREQLQSNARARSLPARVVLRAKIVLLAADGKQDKQIGEELGLPRQTAARWRKRFLRLGVAGLLKDAPRPGRTPAIASAKKAEIVRRTTQEKPVGATHWSSRRMSRAAGVSPSSVQSRRAGRPTASSHIGCEPSSSAMTRISPRNWRTSSACT